MENWFFTHFLSHLPGLLSFYTPLEHTKTFGIGLGEGTFDFGGRGWLYKSLPYLAFKEYWLIFVEFPADIMDSF